MTALGLGLGLPFADKVAGGGGPPPWTPAELGSLLWLDASLSDYKGGLLYNLGTGGPEMDARLGSTANFGRIREGALVLPGISGNYAFSPDNAAFEIPTTVDLICRAQSADWTFSTEQCFISKVSSSFSASTSSYALTVTATGALKAYAGNGTTTVSCTSSAVLSTNDGFEVWVRAKIVVSGGNMVVDFYTSSDGSSWSALGTQQTTVLTGSIYTGGSQDTRIGHLGTGSSQFPFNGVIYRAQIWNGDSTSGGTKVFDIDFTDKVDFQYSMVESSSNTLPVYVATTQPLFVLDGVLRAQGTAANHANVPDESALDITGNLEIVCRCLPQRTASGGDQYMASKISSTTAAQTSYGFYFNSTGTLGLRSSDGTSIFTDTSTVVVPTLTPNTFYWFKVTRSAAGSINFYYAADSDTEPGAWTQIGTTVAGNANPLNNSTAVCNIATRYSGSLPFTGRIKRVIVRNAIGSGTVLDVDFADCPNLSKTGQFYADTGQIVTVTSTFTNSNMPEYLIYSGTKYAYIASSNSNYLSVPDAANLKFPNDMDLAALVALDDWTPASNTGIISKRGAAGATEYTLGVNATGNLILEIDNGAVNTYVSTVVIPVADGASKWLRATRQASSGDIKFYTSDDGSSWTQLGATVVGITGAVTSTNNVVHFGARYATAGSLTGKFYKAVIRATIDGSIVLNIDTSTDITVSNATSFTATSGQTVTVARTTAGKKTVLVVENTLLSGTDDYLEIADHPFLNVGVGIDCTAIQCLRQWAGIPATGHGLNKFDVTGSIGWRFFNNGATRQGCFQIHDGTLNVSPLSPSTPATGILSMRTGIRNIAADNVRIDESNSDGTPSTDTTTTTLSNAFPVRVNRSSNGTANYDENETRAILFLRSVIADADVTDLVTYYGAGV